MSSKELKCRDKFRDEASQDQILTAKGQEKKRWKVVSELLKQELQTDAKLQPLEMILSSVGILSNMSLHTIKDFDGRMSGFQINFAQFKSLAGLKL